MKQFFLLLVLVTCASTQAFGDQFRIADIRVDGLQRVSVGPVFAAMPVRSGDLVDTQIIREITRSLFRTGFFNDVRIARDGNDLIIVVVERPVISEIEIDGNNAIKTEQLEEVMGENGLSEDEIFDDFVLGQLVQQLRRQYVSIGHYGSEIETEIEELGNNQVKIKLLIKEGDAASILHINIIGNEVFSDEELLRDFEIDTTNWLSWMTKNDAYAREKLAGDLEKLESYYLDRGYLDYQLLSTQVSLSPDKESIYITLNISEGQVYKVKHLDLAGDPIFPEETVKRLILLREGSNFSQKLMTQTSEYITASLGNSGYTFASVKGIPQKDQENATVDITFLIDPGDRAYVRRINFRGNTKTSDFVLRREMRQMESAPASNARIEQSKVRLERLGFFKEVEVETKEVPGTSDLVDVEFTVEEQPSGSLGASIGYSDSAGLILGANVQQNNWFGTGKRVGFSVNQNDFITSYRLSYFDPYFTPDQVSRGVDLFFSQTDFDTGIFSTDSYGINFNFGYFLSETQSLSFGFGYKNLELKAGSTNVQEISSSPNLLSSVDRFITQDQFINEYIPVRDEISAGTLTEFDINSTMPVTDELVIDNPPGFIELHGDQYDTGTLQLTWSQSALNRGILATRGSSQSLAVSFTVPGSDLEYYKVDYRGQYFQPLTKDLTLRLKTRLGYGDGYGSLDELPFFENYYAGGLGSVRGFERRTLGPRSSPALTYNSSSVLGLADWEDTNGDGIVDSDELEAAYVRCDDPEEERFNDGSREVCIPGKLLAQQLSRSREEFGGNVLFEAGVELIFPMPFVPDQRSMQAALFIDSGNVFDSDCGINQANCSNFSFSKLSISAGIGLTWISGFGPLQFSIAKPLQKNDTDEREFFQFSIGTGF